MFRASLLATAAIVASAPLSAVANDNHGGDRGHHDALTYAVIGDIPYGQPAVDAFPAHISQINADPQVRRVLHLGDIKNGSSLCDTSYFELIRSDFDGFDDPFVYTPGDNEWTDCHRANNGGYVPTERLAEVRRIFFDNPGRTLGRHARRVDSQSAAFPENVRWDEGGVTFGMLNVPGSNNDLLPWFGTAETPQQQQDQANEYATRNAADLAWLKRIFGEAREQDAAAVVLGIQADMWDPAITGDPAQYSGFTDFVRELARQATRFRGPVLLLNGDSHVYEADRPLADPAATNNTIYGVGYAVPNLQRVTVDGSNNANDYLRLHIDSRTRGVFSWERVAYTP
ncbi:MAG: hypothetical protein QOG68_1272 [Solirubrobacteraceae bacterium]|nr:hypothetical protein [Solirubrobacteraceae bacterium]